MEMCSYIEKLFSIWTYQRFLIKILKNRRYKFQSQKNWSIDIFIAKEGLFFGKKNWNVYHFCQKNFFVS